jgi:hypothetical protein
VPEYCLVKKVWRVLKDLSPQAFFRESFQLPSPLTKSSKASMGTVGSATSLDFSSSIFSFFLPAALSAKNKLINHVVEGDEGDEGWGVGRERVTF